MWYFISEGILSEVPWVLSKSGFGIDKTFCLLTTLLRYAASNDWLHSLPMMQ